MKKALIFILILTISFSFGIVTMASNKHTSNGSELPEEIYVNYKNVPRDATDILMDVIGFVPLCVKRSGTMK